jgi:hypothetical protein
MWHLNTSFEAKLRSSDAAKANEAVLLRVRRAGEPLIVVVGGAASGGVHVTKLKSNFGMGWLRQLIAVPLAYGSSVRRNQLMIQPGTVTHSTRNGPSGSRTAGGWNSKWTSLVSM